MDEPVEFFLVAARLLVLSRIDADAWWLADVALISIAARWHSAPDVLASGS